MAWMYRHSTADGQGQAGPLGLTVRVHACAIPGANLPNSLHRTSHCGYRVNPCRPAIDKVCAPHHLHLNPRARTSVGAPRVRLSTCRSRQSYATSHSPSDSHPGFFTTNGVPFKHHFCDRAATSSDTSYTRPRPINKCIKAWHVLCGLVRLEQLLRVLIIALLLRRIASFARCADAALVTNYLPGYTSIRATSSRTAEAPAHAGYPSATAAPGQKGRPKTLSHEFDEGPPAVRC